MSFIMSRTLPLLLGKSGAGIPTVTRTAINKAFMSVSFAVGEVNDAVKFQKN